MQFIGGQFDAGLLVYPGSDFTKCPDQKVNVQMRLIGNCEIKVFRKSIRFEVALLKARSAFEYSMWGEDRMIENSC